MTERPSPDTLREPRSYREAIRRHLTPREIWLFIVTILVFLSLAGYKHALDKIEDGRRAGTQSTCAIASAVVGAGRQIVEQSGRAPLPPRIERFLVGLGYPPLATRQASAKTSGRNYVDGVTTRIEHVAGLKNSSTLVNRDGSLNCRRLREAAHISG